MRAARLLLCFRGDMIGWSFQGALGIELRG
jgi:hypothetical protein